MISQLLSQSKAPSVLDLGVAAPATGGEAGVQGAFSRLLSALGAAAQGKETSEASETASEGEGDAASVVVLPDIAGTGKNLPADAEALPEAAENAGAAEAALAALALTPPQVVQPVAGEPAAKAGQTPAPAPQLPVGLPLPAQAADEAAKPAAPPAVAIQVAPLPVSGEAAAAAARDPALAAEKPAAGFAGKLQPAGASAERGRDPAAGDRPAAELAAKAPGKVAPEPASIQAPAPVQPSTVAAVPSAVASDSTPSLAADKPAMETGIARELSRIVDSLASAREAMTGKGATLALDHAEFGELSLRFDQRRDGQLGVQIAATDPEAHRAVAAAVADRPAFAQGDGSAPGGQQNAQSGGNGSARGGSLAERDGGSAEGNPPHRERHEGRRRADTDTSGQGARRGDGSAIYA
ncbi:hypothetical protein [Pelagerythrobacter rhizovicinus]|uniref:Flagellar hook-length control protein FliK n=1 Tax=Pelagerythrobacter rhizovicinus TaxID=2268576 RepID=A0A4Q2KJ69_9SPHN|nr:hypothetical protein [Pelagerythrobacter rhizovicinus]RXZ65248.1 hypothetical protein ETX26_00335 [Pelagerythrobacter rhizovicinus]